MRLYASQLKIGGKVIDLDTGREVRKVIWVDCEAGLCEAYQLVDGKPVPTLDSDGARAWATVTLKGRFKFVPTGTKAARRVNMGAPSCAKCLSPLVLMGDDLCPKCKAKDRGKLLKVEAVSPLEMHRCCRCSRDASWAVTDEVEVTPQSVVQAKGQFIVGAGVGTVLFERAATVGRRYYCSSHWKAPQLVDAKGEVIKELQSINPDTRSKR